MGRDQYAQVQARFLLPGMTLVIPQEGGRHRRSDAGLPGTLLIREVTALSNSDFIRVTGVRNGQRISYDLKPEQNVKVQH